MFKKIKNSRQEKKAKKFIEKQDEQKVQKAIYEKILKNLIEIKEISKKIANDTKKQELMVDSIIELHEIKGFVDLFDNMSNEEIKIQLMNDKIEDVIDLFEQTINILEKELGEIK